MSIELLTAVPGGGKTSYAVWHVIKKAVDEGRTVYTVGIPKLTLPTIELTYNYLKNWYEQDIILWPYILFNDAIAFIST